MHIPASITATDASIVLVSWAILVFPLFRVR